jgi:hypothetical protein
LQKLWIMFQWGLKYLRWGSRTALRSPIVSFINRGSSTQRVRKEAWNEAIVLIALLPLPTAEYDMLRYYTIYLLTAIGLTPGGSSTVHSYTQTISRTTKWSRIQTRIHKHNNNNI